MATTTTTSSSSSSSSSQLESQQYPSTAFVESAGAVLFRLSNAPRSAFCITSHATSTFSPRGATQHRRESAGCSPAGARRRDGGSHVVCWLSTWLRVVLVLLREKRRSRTPPPQMRHGSMSASVSPCSSQIRSLGEGGLKVIFGGILRRLMRKGEGEQEQEEPEVEEVMQEREKVRGGVVRR
ncbi:MAG: hypothetical protein M1816_003404 [Peltula sp. TS41687]|nr:MAG: hypothetical protein M1816_003404 [Peltula sp. TS41687]